MLGPKQICFIACACQKLLFLVVALQLSHCREFRPAFHCMLGPIQMSSLAVCCCGNKTLLLAHCREFGPVFSWMLGPTQMTTVVDYEAIKSLLQLGDSKVSCCELKGAAAAEQQG